MLAATSGLAPAQDAAKIDRAEGLESEASAAQAPQRVGDAATPSSDLMAGFEPFQVRTASGITINGVVAGDGPPVLLLHGAPVNLAGWRKLAPALARKYTVVATDLRGYGDSDHARWRAWSRQLFQARDGAGPS
jgi:alpha-beta hydrolase superfamily lysophospholipase